ncbi:type V CRISPR-associated protein Cpf1 [archaeon CG10_big_fil_rev_8_21_14_0_10_43_11]|nr:MAG: type V CRISPR-associated protein Cpf1 [archaeon CG10_big_fil_rev_8_21_14_0_10_43_11]
MNKKGKWDKFTNLYSLSKTLRFELRPIGKDGVVLSPEDATELLTKIIEKDRLIKAAYDALKPVLDKIHEDIINKSLTSDEAKQIDFSEYFEEYKKGKEKKLDGFEKKLREQIGKTFEKTVKTYKITKITKKKEEEEKPLFEIKNGVPTAKAEIIGYLSEQYKDNVELWAHIEEFEGFFGYFSGYNTNRSNYYEYKKEASTAVATRIVHENLPKFCDNVIQFLIGKVQKKKKNDTRTETIVSRKEEYLKAYQYLKDNRGTIQIKDAKTNQLIEAQPVSEDWFNLDKFPKYLSQEGIDEYNRVMGHYNLLINLYNQERKDEKDFKKLSQFKTLFKQIGCGKQSLFEQIKDDTELKEKLSKISKAGEKYFAEQIDDTLITIYTFIEWLRENNDWEGTYWSKAAVDKISNKYLANWHDIKDRIQTDLQGKDKGLKETLKSVATYNKEREEQLKINDAVELSGLFEILNHDAVQGWSKDFFREHILEEYKDLIDEKLTPSQNLIKLICADMQKLAKEFCEKSEDALKIIDYKNENNILQIKEWLDRSKWLLWIVKYFEVKESKVKGNSINPELTNILSALLRADDSNWFDWYDLVRNYLSKKPQEDAKKNKLKLNFESSSFLGGWPPDYAKKAGLLYKKDGLYYLAINYNLSKEDIKTLKQPNGETATRIILDFQKPDNKNTPRLFIRSKGDSFAPAVEKYNLPINDILDIYDTGKFRTEHRKKNEEEYKISLGKLIDYFKKGFLKHDSYKHFNFDWKKTSEYKDIAEFYHDTEVSCYQIKEENTSWKKLLEFIDEGKVFLFQIYNKDFSQRKTVRGKDNIHTYYWKMLFSEENKRNVIYKLNGESEIFFRNLAKGIKKSPAHTTKDYVLNRREKETNKTIPYKIHDELRLFANKNKSIEALSDEAKAYLDKNNEIDENRVTIKKLKHDIVKDKRFTTNKFFLHCPITLNFKAYGNRNVTETVNDNFTQTKDIQKDIQFLGIDRGEKHLIYYSLVNANGEIIEQDHFDVINNKDYLQEINNAADRRKKKQENWQQKGNISNLKDGYISLVIHEIIKKMRDKDGNYKSTFIVLEDLNPGFKRRRQKFEQQVYQKFELALAKKLNYLVDKNVTDMGKIGSVSKALQLVPPVTNYRDIENRKQVGIMLYTRANYTSVTDPVTGWRKTIYLKKGSEADIKKQILSAFTEIGVYSGDYFFQYTDVNGKEWKLWSGKGGKALERYRAKRGKDKNEYIIEPFDVKELLDKLFENFDNSKSLRQQFEERVELKKVNEHTAWETLRFVIDLIQQIRNSGDITKKQEDKFYGADTNKNQDDNFLLSPIRDEQGEHFDSRKYQSQEIPHLPIDADANGAYNIARKGIVMYEHIKQWINDGKQKTKSKRDDSKETTDLDLFISDKEWDLWLYDREKWNEQLPIFASRKLNQKENTKQSDVNINESSEMPIK